MDLKQILKTIKLHEEKISMILGVLILIAAGIFVVNYIRGLKSDEPAQKAAQTQNTNEVHSVTKGETLWKIAENYYKKGSNWKKIADANSISNPTKLEIGQKLIIPDTSPSPQPKADQPVAPKPQITKEAASTTNEIIGASYTVVKGDNLWNIAVRAYGDGYQWVKIAHENHLHNPNLIHSGNVFVIPR